MSRMTYIALATLMGAGSFGGTTIASAQNENSWRRSENTEVATRTTDARVRIPTGTDIPVTIDEKIKVHKDAMGETYAAHITRDVVVDGSVAIPAGSKAQVELAQSETDDNSAVLLLSSVEVNGRTMNVSADEAKADTEKGGWSNRKRAGAGAVAGAVIGAVTGVGVLKGAVVGAGGGLAWGLLDKGRGREIQGETPVVFSLERSLDVQ